MVGAEQMSFLLHGTRLQARSRFFERVLPEDWHEKNGCVIILPEDDPEVFHIYANMACFGNLPILADDGVASSVQAVSGETDKKELDKQFEQLFKVYILANKLMDRHSKDAVVAAVRETALGKHDMSVVLLVYENTAEDDRARTLLLDLILYYEPSRVRDRLIKHAAELPKDFLVEYTARLNDERAYCGECTGEWQCMPELDEYLSCTDECAEPCARLEEANRRHRKQIIAQSDGANDSDGVADDND